MQIDWFTFAAQIINFLILIWLLKKFLYKPVLNVMKKREDEVTARLKEAEKKRNEADAMTEEYRSKMEHLENRREAWLEEAKQESESHKKDLIQSARDEVKKMELKWRESVESDKSLFLDELEKQTFHLTVKTVGRIVTELADVSLEQQALNRFLNTLEKMDIDEREKITDLIDGTDIQLLTTYELNDEDKKRVINTVSELFPGKREYHFAIDKKLGFGLEIRASGWKMGWDMKSWLDDLLAEMNQFLDSEIDQSGKSEPLEEIS